MRIQMSSASSQKKKQDERNSKIIRELAALPANKYCFECGQRGPTYVNITNGSFCCMHCSGLLRGLNPPHRVKSISMATFTNEEIEKLKNMGNEENAKIWLGLHDGPVKFEPIRLDENVRTHLIHKYENRKWYVSPSEIAEQKRLLEAHARRDSVSGLSVNSHKSNLSAPPNLIQDKKNDFVDLLGGDLIFPAKEEPTTHNTKQPFASFQSQSAFPLSHNSTPQPLQFDLFGAPNTPKVQPPPSQQQQKPQQDLFATNFFDAPTINPPPPSTIQQQQPVSKPVDNFANFDAIFGNLSVNSDSTKTSTQSPQPPLPATAPVSNGFMDLPANPVQPIASLNSEKPDSVLEPTKTEEKKDDGPDYSALESLYKVEDEPLDFFGLGKTNTNGVQNSNGFAKSSTIGDFGIPKSTNFTPSNNTTGFPSHSFLSMNNFNQQQQIQQERAPWEPPSTTNTDSNSVSNWNPFS